MNNSELAWYKSSHSGSSGDDCIEVALTWYKSSHSGDSGDSCVEIATSPTTVHIRDSKNTAGPQLAVPANAWTAFVTYAAQED
ncbi:MULTISPECIES: DUF397 domain-containing protein [Streptomyces]|uniref:DUF397 domain-containing protein n=1 Tax=Streptomyces TaxID=1883 RepID=UPI00069B4BE2|nr:DUF397 domain-containing protein [Streptomyces sp. SID7805]MYU52782.1 DUF397 domain-containing protein [Streptomyces sp. SID7805]